MDRAYDCLMNKKYKRFFTELNKGWDQKKRTSSSIAENEKIISIDQCLSQNPTVLAHKLCGAGNGGFFLTFSDKGGLKIPYDCVKINVSPNGVVGRCL